MHVEVVPKVRDVDTIQNTLGVSSHGAHNAAVAREHVGGEEHTGRIEQNEGLKRER